MFFSHFYKFSYLRTKPPSLGNNFWLSNKRASLNHLSQAINDKIIQENLLSFLSCYFLLSFSFHILTTQQTHTFFSRKTINTKTRANKQTNNHNAIIYVGKLVKCIDFLEPSSQFQFYLLLLIRKKKTLVFETIMFVEWNCFHSSLIYPFKLNK